MSDTRFRSSGTPVLQRRVFDNTMYRFYLKDVSSDSFKSYLGGLPSLYVIFDFDENGSASAARTEVYQFIFEILRSLNFQEQSLMLHVSGQSKNKQNYADALGMIFNCRPLPRFYTPSEFSDSSSESDSLGWINFECDSNLLNTFDPSSVIATGDMAFGGAFWPKDKVENGFKLEITFYNTLLSLVEDSRLWFGIDDDWDGVFFFSTSQEEIDSLEKMIRTMLENSNE